MSGPQVRQIGSLTGMRFIAALVVFVSHVRENLFAGIAAVAWGGPAVSFFFVLSGFILTWVYDSRLARSGVRRFYVRRIARLWPLHITCLAICLWLSADVVFGNPLDANSPWSLVAQVLLLQAWIPLGDWMYGFNSVSWSISTEIFFYLVFPLWLAVPRRWMPAGFLISLVLAWALLTVFSRMELAAGPESDWNWAAAAIVNPLVRLPEFVLGILACRCFVLPKTADRSLDSGHRTFRTETIRECIVLAVLVLVAVVVISSQLLDRMYTWTGGLVWGNWLRVAGGMFLFAATIIVFSGSRGALSSILASRMMVWLGEISYAFYLIHQIVIRALDDRMLAPWQLITAAFLVSVLMSGLLYSVVEMPFKTAATMAVSGKRREAVQAIVQGLWSPLGTLRGRVQGVSLVLVLIWVYSLSPPIFDHREIDGIVESTPPGLRDIVFEEEATLAGFNVTRSPGGRTLRLVWKLDPRHSRGRFVHVTDMSDNIISQLPLRQFQTSGIESGIAFVDEIWISNERIYRGYRIGVGFWSEAGGAARVSAEGNEPEIGMGGYRLEVDRIKPRQWK